MASQRSNIASNSSSSATNRNHVTFGNGFSSPPPQPSYNNNNNGSLSSSNSNNNPNAANFNPKLILSQIISLQSFHYVVLGVIFQINHVLFATSITTDRIFTAKFLDIWSAMGWIDNAAVLMSNFIGWVLCYMIGLDWFLYWFIWMHISCRLFSIGIAYCIFILVHFSTQIITAGINSGKIQEMFRLFSNTLFITHYNMFHLWGIPIDVGLVDYTYLGYDNDGFTWGIFLFQARIEWYTIVGFMIGRSYKSHPMVTDGDDLIHLWHFDMATCKFDDEAATMGLVSNTINMHNKVLVFHEVRVSFLRSHLENLTLVYTYLGNHCFGSRNAEVPLSPME